MAQVGIQVAAASAYHCTPRHNAVVRLDETANAVAASATQDVGAEVQANPQDEGFLFIVSHDGTAGLLTIELQHSDVSGSGFTDVNADALMLLGLNSEIHAAALALDVSDAVNQGSLLIAVSGSAREVDANGQIVSPLKEFIRLVYTTDGSWNGTSVNEIGLGMFYHHQPSGNAE